MKTLEDKDREIKRLSHWLGDVASYQDLNPYGPRIWLISYNRKDQTYTLYPNPLDCLNDYLPGMIGYTTVRIEEFSCDELMKYRSRYYGYLPKLKIKRGQLDPGIVFNYWTYGYINPYFNIFTASRLEMLKKMAKQNSPLYHPCNKIENETIVEFKITETGKTWKGRQHDDRI